jgi:hypothetical protein
MLTPLSAASSNMSKKATRLFLPAINTHTNYSSSEIILTPLSVTSVTHLPMSSLPCCTCDVSLLCIRVNFRSWITYNI